MSGQFGECMKLWSATTKSQNIFLLLICSSHPALIQRFQHSFLMMSVIFHHPCIRLTSVVLVLPLLQPALAAVRGREGLWGREAKEDSLWTKHGALHEKMQSISLLGGRQSQEWCSHSISSTHIYIAVASPLTSCSSSFWKQPIRRTSLSAAFAVCTVTSEDITKISQKLGFRPFHLEVLDICLKALWHLAEIQAPCAPALLSKPCFILNRAGGSLFCAEHEFSSGLCN